MDITQGCRTLLKHLYDKASVYGLSRVQLSPSKVAEILCVSEKDTLPVVEFLEQEGYVETRRPLGKLYAMVRLTSPGMKLVMDPSEFNERFNVPTVVVNGDFTYILSAFNIDNSVHNAGLDQSVAEEIKESLQSIAESLKNNEDGPLRKFVGDLAIKGGTEAVVIGVKALLAHWGIGL